MRLSSREIATMALLTGLSIVLTRIASIRVSIAGVEGVRIGIGALPIIMAGVFYGPTSGFVVGALADIVGYPIAAMGPYMPHFTLTSALTGFIPGLLLYYRRNEFPGVWALFGAIFTGQLITSTLLVPYFIHTLFGIPYTVLMPPRIVSLIITVPFYTIFLNVLGRKLHAARLVEPVYRVPRR